MTIQVTGTIEGPLGTPSPGITIRVVSKISYRDTYRLSTEDHVTTTGGAYDFQLNEGFHKILIRYRGASSFTKLGDVSVSDQTPSPITLINLLESSSPKALVVKLQELADDASESAQSASDDADQVALDKQQVTLLAQQVSDDADQVALDKAATAQSEVNAAQSATDAAASAASAAQSEANIDVAVTESQNDIVGGSIFKGSNGETVENGDVVDPGITHLRVLVDGNPAIVTMSPLSSGLVSSLTGESAVIGGVTVSFNSVDGLSSGLKIGGNITDLTAISDFNKVYRYGDDYYVCHTATQEDPVSVSLPLSEVLFKKVNKRERYDTSEVDLFIVYGQSNILGYANSNAFDYARSEQDPNAVRWDGTKLSPMFWQMPSSSGDVSSGNAWTAFTKRYGELTNRKAVIIPCAKGETAIADLSKGTAPYTDMLSWVNGCKSYLSSNGYSVGRISVLFAQGETDVVNGTTRSSYLTSAGQLWADLKSDTGAEVLIISSLGSTETQGEAKCNYIRLAQYQWAKTNPDVIIGFDNAKAFTQENSLLRSDGVHYTLRGYHLMGLGLADSAFEYYEGKTTPELNVLLNNYGKAESVGNKLRKMISFTIQKVSGTWSLIDSSQFNNTCALALTDSTNELLIDVGFPISNVTNVNASFNFIGNRAGCYARLNWSGEQISIKFEMNVNLNVNMATRQVFVYGNDAASLSGKFSFASSGTGEGLLTTPVSTGLPIASNATGGACRASISTPTEISMKAWNDSFTLSDEKIYMKLDNVVSDTDMIPDGTVLTINMESSI